MALNNVSVSKAIVLRGSARVYGKYAGCRSSIGNLKLHTLTNRYYYFVFFLKVIASLKLVDFSIELEPYYRFEKIKHIFEFIDRHGTMTKQKLYQYSLI